MKHKQAWTIAVLFLLAGCILLGGWQINNGGGGGSSAFSALTGSTNTTAAMICGTGCSITTSGTGLISALNYFGTCGGTAGSGITTSVIGLGLFANGAGTCATASTPTSGATVGLPVSHNCLLKNLAVSAVAAGVNASDSVATVYLGNAGGTRSSTGITCTVGTGFSCTDQTHTASATAGQSVAVGIATQASSTAASYGVNFECE